MSSFLLSWNPKRSDQKDFKSELSDSLNGNPVVMQWSVNNSKKPKKGDRFYLIKLGSKGRGIFASGEILCEPFRELHYLKEKANAGSYLNYVNIKFEQFIDGATQTVIPLSELDEINERYDTNQKWTTESSGIEIKTDVINHLDKLWIERIENYITINENEYRNIAGKLDKEVKALQRQEQSFLRRQLFNNSKFSKCCICSETFPIEFLICAHVKKRSACTDDEKCDYQNIVAPMCRFGCDELYERGFIGIKDGKVCNLNTSFVHDHVQAYLDKIDKNDCNWYREETKVYFEWHFNKHK